MKADTCVRADFDQVIAYFSTNMFIRVLFIVMFIALFYSLILPISVIISYICTVGSFISFCLMLYLKALTSYHETIESSHATKTIWSAVLFFSCSKKGNLAPFMFKA